jgi:hypothetical protein
MKYSACCTAVAQTSVLHRILRGSASERSDLTQQRLTKAHGAQKAQPINYNF